TVIVVSFGCKNDYVSLSGTDKSTIQFTENGSSATKGFPNVKYIPDGTVTDEYLSFEDFSIKTKLEGPIVAPSDITLTYSIDAAAVAKFNADGLAANPAWKNFVLLPASNFSLLVTSDVIKQGEVYAPKVTNNLVTHPQLIDGAINYVIPVKVTSSSFGSSIGTGTIFFTIIGNPLAGGYNVTGYFYHPASPRAFTRTALAGGSLSPYSANQLVVELGDLGGGAYYALITIPDPFNTTTNQDVTVSTLPGGYISVISFKTGLPTTNPGYTPALAGFPITANYYNPLTKTFYLRYGYLGGTGYRVTEEIITHI
ncbi:MAG: DUF1735 domain-containing protein, partial [Ferruginibacter sp.]